MKRTTFAAVLLAATACGPVQPAQTPDSTTPTEPTPTAPAPSSPDAPVPTATPDVTPEPVPGNTTVTTEQIAGGIEPGDYQLDAYVVELRPCPKCPPPLSCKPCLGDFLVVHDQASPPAGASKPMLLLKPDQIRQFEAGKQYHFEVHAVTSPGGSGTNHIEVVSASATP